MLTVGSSDLRPEWLRQLAPGGRLLLPLGLRGSQLSVALDLGPDGALRSASVRSCAFIRLRGVGAAPDPLLRVGPRALLQLPEDSAVDPSDAGVLAAALDAPGPVRPVPVPLGPQDVWDGFGLWLSLHDPRAGRLLIDDDGDAGGDDAGDGGGDDTGDGPAAAMFPRSPGYVGVASVGPGAGVAIAGPAGRRPLPGRSDRPASTASGAERDPPSGPDPGADRSLPAAVHNFGPDGAAPAARVLAALAGWERAGRPGADRLRLVVAPGSVAPPAGVLVRLPSAVVSVSWSAPDVAAGAP